MKIRPFSQIRREGLIEQLCRESGRWMVISTEGDMHLVRDRGPAGVRIIQVRYQEGTGWMKFTSEFPVRFPLTGTPAGIFARLLMRNIRCRYSNWIMDLWGSCEGLPYMAAHWPLSIMSPSVFDAICHEIDREIREFHQELRDKFHGDTGRPGPPAGYPPVDEDIRYLGPVTQRLTDRSGQRMLPGQ